MQTEKLVFHVIREQYLNTKEMRWDSEASMILFYNEKCVWNNGEGIVKE